jgi:hypothetical protein
MLGWADLQLPDRQDLGFHDGDSGDGGAKTGYRPVNHL